MPLDRSDDHGLDRATVGHVGGGPVGDAARRPDGVDCVPRLLLREVVDEHPDALLGEREPNLAADAAARARHER